MVFVLLIKLFQVVDKDLVNFKVQWTEYLARSQQISFTNKTHNWSYYNFQEILMFWKLITFPIIDSHIQDQTFKY